MDLMQIGDFNEICRSCLSQDTTASIFELNYEDTQFSTILEELFSTQIRLHDPLPKNLCEKCISEVVHFYNFKKNYNQSEITLKYLLSGCKSPENVEPKVIEWNEDSQHKDSCNTIIITDDVIGIDNEELEDFVKLETIRNNVSEISDEYLENLKIVDDYDLTLSSDDDSDAGHKSDLPDCEIFELSSDSDEELLKQTYNILKELKVQFADMEAIKKELKNEKRILEGVDTGGVLKFIKMNAQKVFKCSCGKDIICDGHQINNLVLENLNQSEETKSSKPIKMYKCRCDKTFTSYIEFDIHRREQKHTVPRFINCKICYRTIGRYRLSQHMRRHTKEKPYECKECPMKFSIKGNLMRHIKTHTGEKPHMCEFCGKAFIQLNTLNTHRLIHTGKMSYICEHCGKKFILEKSLITHQRKHTGEKPFLCMYCGQMTHSLLSFKSHLKLHNVQSDKIIDIEKECRVKNTRDRLPCNICDKIFASKISLATHMLIHGEKKFFCLECNKGFYTKPVLISHTRIHTGERPFSCRVCFRKFAHASALQAHTRIHTGEKPYVCPHCSRGFTQTHHLKMHLGTHTGEKPHVCPYCHKRFLFKGNLKVHIRIHTGERPYKCDVCTLAFCDSNGLKRHKKVKHENLTE